MSYQPGDVVNVQWITRPVEATLVRKHPPVNNARPSWLVTIPGAAGCLTFSECEFLPGQPLQTRLEVEAL